MLKQKCEAYNSKISDIQQKFNKFKFPYHRFIQEEQSVDYREYLINQASQYRENLNKRLVKFVDLNLPSNHRFDSIIKRAFEKRPPFEGKESNSDKGFKDALLWESILEYKQNNENVNIMLYSDDKLFCDDLTVEFRRECQGADILIFAKNQESILIKELENIAYNIDKFSYIEDTSDDLDYIKSWIFTEEFAQQVFKFQSKLKEVNKYTKLFRVQVDEIFDIEESETENEIIKDIRISLRLKFIFLILDKTETAETYDVAIYANIIDGTKIEIDDIEIEEGGEANE